MIEILRILSCISYAEFLQIMNKSDDYYTKDKFKSMKSDLAGFLLEIDSSLMVRFIDFASDKYTGVSEL